MNRDDPRYLPHSGAKPVLCDLRAAVSTQHPASVDAALDVLRAGGNAADAGIAALLTDATLLNASTSLAGILTALYYDAKTGHTTQIIGTGRLPEGLAPFRPIPAGATLVSARPPAACIPGLMPALKALHERFGTHPWSSLCAAAIGWAEEGFPLSSRMYSLLDAFMPFIGYFPEGRSLFLDPDGHLPAVGTRFKNPALAKTLRTLAAEGPDCFISGSWAHDFIAKAHTLGWPITLEHMNSTPALIGEPLSYRLGKALVLQLGPPEGLGVVCSIVTRALERLGYSSESVGSPEGLYWIAHALRWALKESGYLHSQETFRVPIDILTDPQTPDYLARLIRHSMPRVDLTDHVRLTSGPNEPRAAGWNATSREASAPTPLGTCALAVADAQGNWLQLTHTLQSGGIPGMVVGGVPMYGSHMALGALSIPGTNSALPLSGWLAPQARMRCYLGDTLVLCEGQPWLALGTPSSPHFSVPQVLADIVLGGLAPDQARARPRITPLEENYRITAEARLPPDVVGGLARLGIQTTFTRPWDGFVGGSFQMCWRAPDGTLSSAGDPRGMSSSGGLA